MSEEQRLAANDLEAAGWLRMHDGEVELSPKARGDRRWLVRTNSMIDLVPLASKELVKATAVRSGPDGAPQVDFRWRWIPNEIGSAFRSGAVHDRFAMPQAATATLMRDGASWAVLRIRPAAQ